MAKSIELTKTDALSILTDVFKHLKEAGIEPRMGKAPAKGGRPEGIMIYLPMVEYDPESGFVEMAKKTVATSGNQPQIVI